MVTGGYGCRLRAGDRIEIPVVFRIINATAPDTLESVPVGWAGRVVRRAARGTYHEVNAAFRSS